MATGRNLAGEFLDEIKARSVKSLDLYLNPPPAEIDRRDSSPTGLRLDGTRQRNVVIERCPNPYCREWPIAGSLKAGECLSCGTPLGAR